MRAVLVALLAVLWLASLSPALAQAGSGSILGVVENGTAGGPAVGAGLRVTLYRVDGETELEPLQSTTGADGGFRFDGLDTGATLVYWPEVSYLGVSYGTGQGLSFQEGEPELRASVAVYETTDDDSGLRVESMHLVAESFEQVLRISEVYVLSNSGDRTFAGRANEAVEGRVTSVFIPLPEARTGLAFPEGEDAARFVEVEDGLWDTQPVLPGAEGSVVRFSYHLVVQGASVPLERRFSYPVSSLTILAVQPGLSVVGDRLTEGDPITFQEREYQVYHADSLDAAVPLGFDLVVGPATGAGGMPAAAQSEPASQPAGVGQQHVLRWLGLVLVVAAAAGAIAYPFVTRPRSRA